MLIDGCDFRGAVANLLGLSLDADNGRSTKQRQQPDRAEQLERDRRKREAEQRLDERRKLQRAGLIWAEAIPIACSPGEAWLAGRGIALDSVPEHGGLRFHPQCPFDG